jgi:hypothetical protein
MSDESTIPPTLERAKEQPSGPILSHSVADSDVNFKKKGISCSNKGSGLKLGYNLHKNL